MLGADGLSSSASPSASYTPTLLPETLTNCPLHTTMAEIFGIAAGVVGLASLGVQLTDSISKLQEICRTYKDAPEDIAALITTLETLARIIDQSGAGTHRSAANVVHVQLLEDCTKWCRGIRNSINNILQAILSDISHKPRAGKMKVVFQKKAIDGWLQRLERSKLDLLLAHQIFGR
jgi:prophage DNA circulation protein